MTEKTENGELVTKCDQLAVVDNIECTILILVDCFGCYP